MKPLPEMLCGKKGFPVTQILGQARPWVGGLDLNSALCFRSIQSTDLSHLLAGNFQVKGLTFSVDRVGTDAQKG